MSLLSTIGRMGLSTIFVSAGLDGLQNPGYVASTVRDAGLPEPELLEQVHHGTNVVAGAAMGLGVFPRLSALALLGNLVPTTLVAHNPADHDDPMDKQAQQVHRLKNISLMGGLAMVLGRAGKNGRDETAAVEQEAEEAAEAA